MANIIEKTMVLLQTQMNTLEKDNKHLRMQLSNKTAECTEKENTIKTLKNIQQKSVEVKLQEQEKPTLLKTIEVTEEHNEKQIQQPKKQKRTTKRKTHTKPISQNHQAQLERVREKPHKTEQPPKAVPNHAEKEEIETLIYPKEADVSQIPFIDPKSCKPMSSKKVQLTQLEQLKSVEPSQTLQSDSPVLNSVKKMHETILQMKSAMDKEL
ncbi:hypothetical protein EIN_181240 [Entamoeba invadens IP1]|uniref:hypothetical protein n=1 Tax=Entamoeba invadens IP1 TaxID=370355 RepID=UPI0002C3DC16|nr:hypothetical protein EIN_181240 [Entamoeba invadens IP1]ELP93967.1 hypothetical protein EIN_181240 [Entamoeba invadens IP1]|eukprot:XP_004260738.1 hypothetical protein EIN_181240 [Entamoeba invadens IP1]